MKKTMLNFFAIGSIVLAMSSCQAMKNCRKDKSANSKEQASCGSKEKGSCSKNCSTDSKNKTTMKNETCQNVAKPLVTKTVQQNIHHQSMELRTIYAQQKP